MLVQPFKYQTFEISMLIAPEALGFDEMILISSVPRRKERYL